MSQRAIEIIVGRLITDEGFRGAFLNDPQRAFEVLEQEGLRLTSVERRALLATRAAFWVAVADEIDPSLQKASLRPDAACTAGPRRR